MKLFNLENCLIFCWLVLLFSINSVYVYTLQIYQITNFFSFFNLSTNKILILLNVIRFYLPFFIFPFLLIIFFTAKFSKIDSMIILFILYFLFQLFAFLVSDRFDEIENITLRFNNITYQKHTSMFWDNILLIICALDALVIIAISRIKNLKNFIKKIFIISLIFISLISFYFVFVLLSESFAQDLKYIYGTNALNPSGKTFEQASPRITGVSRMLLILYFFFFCMLLAKPKKFFFYIVPIILLLLIYKMQARGALVGIIISLLILIFFANFNFQLKLKIIFLVFLIPILLFESYYYIKSNSKNSDRNEIISKEIENPNMASHKNRIISEKTTSGRTTIWQNIIFIIKEKKIILGYGPQADRDLLLDFKIKYEKSGIFFDKDKNRFAFDNNASNAFFYSYLCGGIFTFVILIAIYLITFKKILKKIFYQKIFKSREWFESFTILLIIYLLQRGIYENSISLFSIDFLFFILSFTYIAQSAGKNIYK